MGILDNLFDAVESGAVEKRLNQFADAVDKTSKEAHGKLQDAANRPAKVLKPGGAKRPVAKKQVTSPRAKTVRGQPGVHMDIIRKKR